MSKSMSGRIAPSLHLIDRMELYYRQANFLPVKVNDIDYIIQSMEHEDGSGTSFNLKLTAANNTPGLPQIEPIHCYLKLAPISPSSFNVRSLREYQRAAGRGVSPVS